MKIRTFLQDQGQSISVLLAVTIALIFSWETFSLPIVPITDGQGYAMRGFALYGYLHTGQWANFWRLFSFPNQSICPPHYLVFFLFPAAMAGTVAYVLSQNLVVYGLLALAVCRLCQILDRRAWAPAIFLLCAVNNAALTDYFSFYLDMEFLSVTLYAIAWQLTAWREGKASISLLSGLVLSLTFWTKPANALIFITVFALAEIFHCVRSFIISKSRADRRHLFGSSLRHWGYQALGLIPSVSLGFYCGGTHTILQLILSNEIDITTIPLDCGILLRLFYFPLCLSYFYHVLLLGGCFLVVLLIGKIWKPAAIRETSNFAGDLFLPLVLAYLVWGEFFSFWMHVKVMRSLLPILPIFWISLFWILEKRRLSPELMVLAAAVYAAGAFSQKAFNLLGTSSIYVDDTYQLNRSSWVHLPTYWKKTNIVNMVIADNLVQSPPPPGIICVNSLELQKPGLAVELQCSFTRKTAAL